MNSPHKGSVTRKLFPFDDVIMECIHMKTRIDEISEPIMRDTRKYVIVVSTSVHIILFVLIFEYFITSYCPGPSRFHYEIIWTCFFISKSHNACRRRHHIYETFDTCYVFLKIWKMNCEKLATLRWWQSLVADGRGNHWMKIMASTSLSASHQLNQG